MRTNDVRTRCLAALLLFACGLPALADPCTLDADCDDAVECNGIETCGFDGACRAGVGLCGPPNGFAGTAVVASSFYGAAYVAANAIDGVDASGSSWCAASGDPAPAIAVTWPVAIEVEEIRVLTAWSPGYDFLTARFRLLDGSGGVVFEIQPVALTAGEVAVPVVPPAPGVRRVEMTGLTWRSNAPCLSELAVVGAARCSSDADCRLATPCLGVGVCMPSGQCAATAGRCRNLATSFAAIEASSSYDSGYPAEHAADGVDDSFHSWCAATGDPAPALRLELPNDYPVYGVTASGPWASNRLRTARVTATDSQGATTFDSGTQTLVLGELSLVLEPDGVLARRIDLEGLTFDDGPCVGELEVLGESCGIDVTGDAPFTVAFRPGTPTPDFELRAGLLSEMREDLGFERSTCLGRYAAASVELPLPDPPAGDGWYVLGRGFDACAAEGYGLSFVRPDPRAALAAGPACSP